MKKILIITPHFPPSNLAAVHRSRLFAQHLPAFGWEPIILTVHEDYYEESLDHNLEKLVPEGLEVHKVKAAKVTQPRIIGDIGIRAFISLYRKAKQLVQHRDIDFVYIPIPSFYSALIGRMLYQSTGVKYGIDYIDPWVHQFPGSDRLFSRHWFSTQVAKMLEPIAVKHATLITGVAEGYYQGVQERNPHLLKCCYFGAMPYGGEAADHAAIDKLDVAPYLFKKVQGVIDLVYAGAMLPKAYGPLEAIFQAIVSEPDTFGHVRFHFIGTGKTANNPDGYNIKPLAEQYGLWERVIFEYPKRIPYLDVLVHLEAADGVFILGSTEPHYTPSKTYQAVLAGKPVLAVLHQDSTAVEVVYNTKAGLVLPFAGEAGLAEIQASFVSLMKDYLSFLISFDLLGVDQKVFEEYSAKFVTQRLALLLTNVNNRHSATKNYYHLILKKEQCFRSSPR